MNVYASAIVIYHLWPQSSMEGILPSLKNTNGQCIWLKNAHTIPLEINFLVQVDHRFCFQILQHVLVLVNDVLTNKENIKLFEEIEEANTPEKAGNADAPKGLSSWEPFLDLLNRPDEFIVNQSCLILAKVSTISFRNLPTS